MAAALCVGNKNTILQETKKRRTVTARKLLQRGRKGAAETNTPHGWSGIIAFSTLSSTRLLVDQSAASSEPKRRRDTAKPCERRANHSALELVGFGLRLLGAVRVAPRRARRADRTEYLHNCRLHT
eukprot:6212850-Pleurochrysis_carterae.AAC.7